VPHAPAHLAASCPTLETTEQPRPRAPAAPQALRRGGELWARRGSRSAHLDGYDPYGRGVTGEATPPWYTVRVAGWHVLSLNSEAPLDRESAQVRWLRRELRRDVRGCTLAFWHRPRYSAGKHGDQRDVAPLWNAVRGHATLVLNGHDHNLQRLRPRDGITELVAGAGGRSRYRLDARDPRLAFASDRVDGAVRLKLRPGRASVRLVAADG